MNSTARGAFDLGYPPDGVDQCHDDRPLPGLSAGGGAEVPATAIQSASLAPMADLFAVVVPDGAAIPQ